MAYIFRTYQMKIDPSDPEKKRRVYVLDSKGRKIPHPRWRFSYTDFAGRRKIGTGMASEARTAIMAVQLQSVQDQIKMGIRPAPRCADQHASRPFADVCAEYLAEGKAHGGRGGRPWGEGHARMREWLLNFWAKNLNLQTLGDLSAAGILVRAEKVLQVKQQEGCAPKTQGNYREGLFAFCIWAVERGYLEKNPLEHLKGYDSTPRTIRRAMTGAEVKALLETCRPEWRLLYETAIFTGLRRKEIASLEVSHLDLDGGGLHLDAAWTKNRRAGFQPLPSGLLKRLADAAQGRDPSAPLLHVPNWPAIVLRVDLKRAGIPEKGPGGKVDFHSLRTTYVNLVLDSGASVKEAMDLARHLSPNMTMNVYGRSRWDRKAGIVEQIGNSINFEPESITQAQPKMAVLGMAMESSGLRVSPAGFEPALPD